MFDAIRKLRKKHSCDFSFREELARQSQQTMDSMLETYRACQNRTSDEMQAAMRESLNGSIFLNPLNEELYQKELAETNRWHDLCKDLSLNGTTYSLGTNIFDEKKAEANPDRQRCKYCGCLVSSFDTHCKSCGAPI